MKFCFITTFFPPNHFGGDAVFVASLANLLAASGHKVQVVHCADSFEALAGNVPPSSFSVHADVQVHTLRSRWGSLPPVLTHLTGRPLLYRERLREILDQDFDVTHWHNISLIGGAGALALGRGVRLCTLHDYCWLCPTSILFKYNRRPCVQKSCVLCSLTHKRPPQLWRSGSTLRDGVDHVDCFLSPSEFVREKYEESDLGISSTVLPLFVCGSQLNGDFTREDYYLYVGRLERAKGLQSVIPLFGETNRQLVIAGAGSYEAALRKQASRYPCIRFVGRVPYQDVGPLYAKARATILPSLCDETFGLTVLESLLQKTPSIVSRSGALPEVISATGGGAIYDGLSELQSLLNRWDEDPCLPAQLGAEGFQHLDAYSPEVHLEKYTRIIAAIEARKST